MSDIEFDCPECGGLLVVSERGSGKTVNCTLCSKPIRIPEPETPDNVREVEVTCPHCNQSIEAPPETLGSVVDCPACNKRFQMPTSGSSANSQSQVAVEKSKNGSKLKCFLGFHKWSGCTCSICGKRRPHVWSIDQETCVRCGGLIEIATLAELQAINNNVAGHYKLVADIDASETASWNGGEGFRPIGSESDFHFLGVLDGAGHTVTGLVIKSAKLKVAFIDENWGTIKNLHLSDVNIVGMFYCAGLVCENTYRGTVDGCSSHGNVMTLRGCAGGLVGTNHGRIVASSSSGELFSSCEAGGLVGNNEGGEIINSKSSCHTQLNGILRETVVPKDEALAEAIAREDFLERETGKDFGGLVGINSGIITNCYAFGNVAGKCGVGGLVGSDLGKVTNSTATGKVSGRRGLRRSPCVESAEYTLYK